ncbi:MAG: UDP-N-acetylmuramate:L-alanyl-gamma-D-glutamyl-meso-diaminopimelate ligase [Pseudomonadota bacterium]
MCRTKRPDYEKTEVLKPPGRVHLMGICGTGMGSLAGLFLEAGYRVTGSDQAAYPPMSDYLGRLGIRVMEGYDAGNLDEAPDLVVVGNVIRRSNPEAAALEKSGIAFVTMPEAITRYFAWDKTRIVITGTHGKTTVSSMIAWILHSTGMDPGFMIGGIPGNFGKSCRAGLGPYFVIEGDEYDTAYFEKTPKFLHYHPKLTVITSCELDHVDIYANIEDIRSQFRRLVESMPDDGFILYYGDDPTLRNIVRGSAPVSESYGLRDDNDWIVRNGGLNGRGLITSVIRRGIKQAEGNLPVLGTHNLLNASAAVAVANRIGISASAAVKALASFKGVHRRQEIAADEGGLTVVDDFAHHPTAVKATVDAVKARYPERRLVAVFEPRTNSSRRSVFQEDYAGAFPRADVIVVREPRDVAHIPPEDRFSAARLTEALRSEGKEAVFFDDTEGITAFLGAELRRGDVVLVMSNGNFDGLVTRLVSTAKERAA